MIYLYYTDRFMSYNFGPDHPMKPVRLMLTYKLMEEYGFLDEDDVVLKEPGYASREDLLTVHTDEYLRAVKAEERNFAFGLGTSDNPVFEGMYDASRLVSGGSIDAANQIIEEDCSAFNIGGGLHHAHPSMASGFCIFNDAALAIKTLKRRFQKVLYVDIDAHHADGVQHVFYSDPQVLKISLHESGRYLFPGTGFVEEAGSGAGKGYTINIPMPRRADDLAYRLAFEEIVPPLFEWFRPEVVVAQLGADAHHQDPLTSLNMTLEGYGHLVGRIKELTDFYSGGRLLALGGGGYNISVVPIAWALVLQTMRGEKMPEYLPPNWVELFKSETGGRRPLTLPDEMPMVEDEEHERIRQELSDTLAGLKAILSKADGVF